MTHTRLTGNMANILNMGGVSSRSTFAKCLKTELSDHISARSFGR